MRCPACEGLDHPAFLPAGDPAPTRRAKALSGRHAVVVRWAGARKRYEGKRYERQGWLVEEGALGKAMAQLRDEGREPAWRLEDGLRVRAAGRRTTRR